MPIQTGKLETPEETERRLSVEEDAKSDSVSETSEIADEQPVAVDDEVRKSQSEEQECGGVASKPTISTSIKAVSKPAQ